jgi:hypothetical protein
MISSAFLLPLAEVRLPEVNENPEQLARGYPATLFVTSDMDPRCAKQYLDEVRRHARTIVAPLNGALVDSPRQKRYHLWRDATVERRNGRLAMSN